MVGIAYNELEVNKKVTIVLIGQQDRCSSRLSGFRIGKQDFHVTYLHLVSICNLHTWSILRTKQYELPSAADLGRGTHPSHSSIPTHGRIEYMRSQYLR